MKTKTLLVFVLILAFVMRMIVVGQSFWLDEAIGALVVKERNLVDIAINFPKGDNHPPLYYMLLEIWSNIFGYSEIALRSLSVLFGVGSVFVTYKIAQLITSHKSQITHSFSAATALLLATSGFHIYYSQEARMYMMAAFFASLSIYSYMMVLRKMQNIKYWAIFSLSIVALAFTDYVPVFLLPIFWVYPLIVKKDKRWWKIFIASHTPLLVFGILWLPTLLYQSQRGRWLLQTLPAWRNVAGGATLKQAVLVWTKFVLGRISLIDKGFYYSIVVLASAPFVYLLYKAWRKKRGEIQLVWMWLLIPLVLGFVASFMFPAFIYFRFVYVYPAFILLTAYGLFQIASKNIRNIVFLCLLLINLLSWGLYIVEPYQQREHWRDAIGFVESKAKDNDIALFTNPEPFAPARYYSTGKLNLVGTTDSIFANKDETIKKTNTALLGKSGVYYFEYLQDLHDPNGYVLSAILDNGFFKKEIYSHFPGIGFITYYTR